MATSGRFHTYAFWVQDDFKVNAEADAQPRPALRHHEALHRGLRPLVVHEPRPAQSRRRRLPGRDPVRRLRREQLPVQDADQDLLRQRRPAHRLRLQPERAHRAARLPTASCTRGAAPSAAAPARATAPARSASRPTPRSRARNGFAPAYNWNNGVPAYPKPPFFDPTLNAGFVTGRGRRRRRHLRRSGDRRPSAALPELEHRHPVRADVDDHASAPPTPAATATSSAAAAAASTPTSSIRTTWRSATC